MKKGGLSKYWMDGESWHAINSLVPHSQGQAYSSLVINLLIFFLGGGMDVYIAIVMNSNTAGILISEPHYHYKIILIL